MMSNNFNIESVEELLMSSKQLQNKIRKELNLEDLESRVVSEFPKPGAVPLPPAWDDAMLVSYVDNIATDYHQTSNKLNVSTKLSKNKKPLSKEREVKTKSKSLPRNSNNKEKLKNSFSNFRGPPSPASDRIHVAEKTSKKLTSPVCSNAKCSHNINDNSINSRIKVESNKLAATSSSQFKLQRFVGHKNKSIDFFKEHPDLELDMAADQTTTLFPRRFHRSTKSVCHNGKEYFKAVDAEAKPPKIITEMTKPETWNGILKQNKPVRKAEIKIVRLKRTNETALDKALKCPNTAPEPQIKEPDKSCDIIASNSSKGLFTFRKQSRGAVEQKKCHLQRFPVLYIKPECIVQKVANISICDKTESTLRAVAVENSTSNVKYIECSHEDEKKTLELESIPDAIIADIKQTDSPKEGIAIKKNKFFIAQHSPAKSESSSLDREQLSSYRSLASISSSSSSSVNEIQPSLRSPTTSILSTSIGKNSVRNLANRCEVHVQTEKECKKSISTMTSPLQNPEKLQSDLTTTVNMINKFENSSGDDVIAQIFQRILSDLPNVLEEFKNSNIPKTSFSKSNHDQADQNQKYQKQTPDLNVKMDGKYFPNENGKEKAKGKDRYVQTISQISVDSSDDSSISMLGEDKGVLFLQNPLFVETIKQNESSTVHDVHAMKNVKRINYIKEEYPKEAEIKRAVKIFIDSLTLGGCGIEKNAIFNETSTQKEFMTLSNLKLLTGDKLNRYSSSDLSDTSKSLNESSEIVRNVNNIRNRRVCLSKMSRSSTTTSIALSSTDSETDTTNDVHTISSHTNNISEGEIKSLGET